MQKILLADDHTLVLEAIADLVTSLGSYEVVDKVQNGSEAIKSVAIFKPDIVLMDVDMPVLNGLEATRQLKRDYPDLKIIILTMHGDPALIKRMMELGADGFLLKNSDRSEFEEALKRVAAGKTYFSSDAAQAVITGKNRTSGDFTVGEESILLSTLSEREREILQLIAEGFSNKEIGEKLFISHRTVDTHRTNMMKKLEIRNTAGLVSFALKNGIMYGRG